MSGDGQPLHRLENATATLGRRAAAILGLTYPAWIRMVLGAEAVRVLLASQNRPALLRPGTPIWAREPSGTWTAVHVADGSAKVWIRDEVHGVPGVVDPTETALAVTWVGRGDHFVVHRLSCVWQAGECPDLGPAEWRHALTGMGGPGDGTPLPKPKPRHRKVLAVGGDLCENLRHVGIEPPLETPK